MYPASTILLPVSLQLALCCYSKAFSAHPVVAGPAVEDLRHVQDKSPKAHTKLDGPAQSPKQARVLLPSPHPLLTQAHPINLSICSLACCTSR